MSRPSIGTGTYLCTLVADQAREVVAAAVERCGGIVVGSHPGGSEIAQFVRVGDAIRAASALVVEIAGRDDRATFKAGVHTGESVVHNGESYGADINLAARLAEFAAAGQVLVSSVSAQLGRAGLPAGVRLADIGTHRLKEFGEPQELFQLVGADPTSTPTGSPATDRVRTTSSSDAFLEVWGAQGPELTGLEDQRVTIGKAAFNDIPTPSDPTVSRVHAVFERLGHAWCIRDLTSRNGTFVNGDRIIAARPLHTGDEIRVGRTRVVFRARDTSPVSATAAVASAPDLTRRERDVLEALCRPMVEGSTFRVPASTRDMAADLCVSVDAVKQHLANLYAKFGLYDGRDRRAQLANEALRSGAVNIGGLTHPSPRDR